MRVENLEKEFKRIFILTNIYEEIFSTNVASDKESKTANTKLLLLKKQILDTNEQIKQEIEEIKKQSVKRD